MQATPRLGGAAILLSFLIVVTIAALAVPQLAEMLWGNNPVIGSILLGSLGIFTIGFLDDLARLSPKTKLLGEFLIGALVVWGAGLSFASVQFLGLGSISFPEWFGFGLACLWIVGMANAVNLIDGLDGLATVPVMLVALSFTLISYVVGNTIFSEYLQIQYIPDVGELSIFCGSIVGACLGFLWYNAPPAKIFMGDTGSLALGSLLGTVSLIAKHEVVLLIAGGVFVLEALSVIIQVFSFKVFGKRVFRMAPLHHHFEKKGWEESTIVIRFWIISIILVLIALSSLKLR